MPTPLQTLEPRCLFAAGDPLDTFGHHGTAFTPYALYSAQMSEVKNTPDGKLLAAVAVQKFRPTRPGVTADFIRFNADGSEDATFGGTGSVDSFFTTVRRVTVRSDGKFYALGSTTPLVPGRGGDGTTAFSINGTDDWFVARFHADGTLDRSFGTRGKVALHLSRTATEIESVGNTGNFSSFLDSDGRVTLLADYRPAPGQPPEPAIFRYDIAGRFDPAFNSGAPLRLQTAADRRTLPSINVTRTGDILVTSVRSFRHHDSTIVQRFDADGSADNGFGDGGLVTVAQTSSSVPTAAAAADGSVFVSAYESTYVDGHFQGADRVHKLNADGTPDTAFGGGTVTVGSGVNPLLPLPEGGVVLGGGAGTVRLVHADGTPDVAFGKIEYDSRMPIVVGDTIFALRYDSEYQKNRQHRAVSRYAVTTLSLGGNGVGPVTLAGGKLTLTGTGDDDYLDVTANPDIEGRPVTSITASRGFWSRTVPVARVTAVVVNGEGGNDDIRAFFSTEKNIPVTLNGGTGDDAFAGYGTGITAFGGAGNDTVYGDLTRDSDV